MAEPPVKMEPGIKPEPMDQDFDDPGLDEDVYEDTGDLEFGYVDAQGNPVTENANMFLVRLPKYLWEAWSEIDDDKEIQIGTIRRWETHGTKAVGHGQNKRYEKSTTNNFKMLLFDNRPEHLNLPKEYDLQVTDPCMDNTFLFTEQDMGYHTLKGKVKAEQQKAGIPQNLIRSSWANQTADAQGDGANSKNDAPRSSGSKFDRKNRRYNPYRKAVPKKTAIMGRFRHELNCGPVMNEESKQFLNERVKNASAPKRPMVQMSIAHIADAKNVIITGTTTANKLFEGFIAEAPKPVTKAKKQEAKATRVPVAELRDMLSNAFKQYSYWGMKELRAATKQPEAYLRENLEIIAVLNRSGTHANTWSLKPEFKADVDISGAQDARAPGDSDDSEEEEGSGAMVDMMRT